MAQRIKLVASDSNAALKRLTAMSEEDLDKLLATKGGIESAIKLLVSAMRGSR